MDDWTWGGEAESEALPPLTPEQELRAAAERERLRERMFHLPPPPWESFDPGL